MLKAGRLVKDQMIETLFLTESRQTDLCHLSPDFSQHGCPVQSVIPGY